MKITTKQLRHLIREELNTEQGQPNLEEATSDPLAEAANRLGLALDFAGREGVPANHPQLLEYLQEALALVERAKEPVDPFHGVADPWRAKMGPR